MTNFARIINGVAVDVSVDPDNCFHPALANEFVEVPDQVTHGWTLNGGQWVAPAVSAPTPDESTAPVESGNLSPTPPLLTAERAARVLAGLSVAV
ncbi:hypothetical protein [Pseudomonas helleri]|uniref:hypothetical protein n=1 Tax=Pseudomonas helleri TaxID=1608996 RepID=UPI003F9C057D